MMIPLDDIQCFLFEGGAYLNFESKRYQPLGSNIIQQISEPPSCSYKESCPFRLKFNRCPTWEEIKAKYYTNN